VAFYVTTPIYYVNGEPHLGHAYTTIAADVLARHMRQRGEDVFFLTGTDEHGEPVALAAEKQGMTPRELADKNAERFKAVSALVNATNDFFIRTSDPRHVAKVQEVLQRVHDAGHVYKGVYEGFYCPRCADFKSDTELVEGDKCPIHLIELHREREENWFFRLSSFQERLERMFEERPGWVVPRNRYNEALAFVKQGLNDISLTRARITWGVPVPWDDGHVFYVWFDALLNYYTALSFAREGEDLTERFWPATVHVMAKDILKFHTVFWPALLMAADLELPERDFVHGYLLMDEHKMSKSLGNVVDPFRIVELYGSDALRYYLLREVSFGQDGSISTEGFERRYTSELANEYGNLASRTLAMVAKYRDGIVPDAEAPAELAAVFADAPARAIERFDGVELTAALEEIWSLVRRLNAFVQEEQPWQLAKDEAQAGRLDSALYALVEGLRVVSLLLLPFVPESAEKLLRAIGQDDRSLEAARFGSVGGGARCAPLEPLFPRVEVDSAA
jgi:methionyl-tRNA synthetase